MSDVHLCRFLRWKGFYGNHWATSEALAVELATRSAPFTCLRTCQTCGPDGDLVTPEGCAPDRACFEVSPKTPRRVS